MADLDNLDTKNVRETLEKFAEDLKNDIALTFDSLHEPINDVNAVLESKFLKRFLIEFGKLKIRICETMAEKLEECASTLEEHDGAIQEAFEELIEEEEG